MNERTSQHSQSADWKKGRYASQSQQLQQSGSGSKKSRKKSPTTPKNGSEEIPPFNAMNSNKQGQPGVNGEQVEYEVGTKDGGPWDLTKKVPSFNGMSRREIEEKRAYKYRGKSLSELWNYLFNLQS